MKKSTKIWIIIGVIIFILILWFIGIYNSLINAEARVDEQWANVETVYQRRLDLIPNLVATVQGAADFETQLQTQVTSLRSGLTAATTPEDLEILGTKIESAINLVFERYPDIKSTENFLALQSQLEGTENRISVERTRYNEEVRKFNVKIKRIPNKWVANSLGYKEKGSFEADEGAEKVPEVEF